MTPEGAADGPDVAALRAAAEKATPGPWVGTRSALRRGGTGVVVAQADSGRFILCDPQSDARVEDAEFIAAANPAAILALLDRLAAVTEQRDQYAALTHDERVSLAEQIRVAFDTPPEQRLIHDTWLYAAAWAEQWYLDRSALGADGGGGER